MREPVPSLSIAAYAAATLAPLPLLAAGSVLGGPWLWAGLAYLGAISLLLDQLLPFAETDPPDAPAPPAAETLLVLLGLLSLALPVIAVAGAAGPSLSWLPLRSTSHPPPCKCSAAPSEGAPPALGAVVCSWQAASPPSPPPPS